MQTVPYFTLLFEHIAARHDCGELGVVHHFAAGVRGEVLFHHFFFQSNQCQQLN